MVIHINFTCLIFPRMCVFMFTYRCKHFFLKIVSLHTEWHTRYDNVSTTTHWGHSCTEMVQWWKVKVWVRLYGWIVDDRYVICISKWHMRWLKSSLGDQLTSLWGVPCTDVVSVGLLNLSVTKLYNYNNVHCSTVSCNSVFDYDDKKHYSVLTFW